MDESRIDQVNLNNHILFLKNSFLTCSFDFLDDQLLLTLIFDTCYMYVGAPMTFFEARGSNDILRLYEQRRMAHLRYPEKVWIQGFNYLEKCTSIIYRSIEIDNCNNESGFNCEIEPKVKFKMFLVCSKK